MRSKFNRESCRRRGRGARGNCGGVDARQIEGRAGGWVILEKMKERGAERQRLGDDLPELDVMKVAALKTVPVPFNAGVAVTERPAMMAKVYSSLLTDPGIEKERSSRARSPSPRHLTGWIKSRRHLV